jgi:3-oxoacyl-[acyl-carrier-protein] synthase II
MTAPHPEGAGARLAIERALTDAGLEPDAIDFINAHGTGTPHNDSAEWRALEAVFGARARRLPLTSTKGSVGHLLGACGALEAVVTVLSLGARELHPTPGWGEIDEDCPVDLVTLAPRSLPACRTALSLNLAFGGANAALVIRRMSESEAAPR